MGPSSPRRLLPDRHEYWLRLQAWCCRWRRRRHPWWRFPWRGRRCRGLREARSPDWSSGRQRRSSRRRDSAWPCRWWNGAPGGDRPADRRRPPRRYCRARRHREWMSARRRGDDPGSGSGSFPWPPGLQCPTRVSGTARCGWSSRWTHFRKPWWFRGVRSPGDDAGRAAPLRRRYLDPCQKWLCAWVVFPLFLAQSACVGGRRETFAVSIEIAQWRRRRDLSPPAPPADQQHAARSSPKG